MKLCCGSFGNDAVCCYQVEDFLLSQLNSLQNSNVILKMKFLACMIYRKENSGGPMLVVEFLIFGKLLMIYRYVFFVLSCEGCHNFSN